MTLIANDSTQEFTSCTEVLEFYYTSTQIYPKSDLFMKVVDLPKKGGIFFNQNKRIEPDLNYPLNSLTYQANDCDDTYNDILTYKISYDTAESNTSSITLIKYVDLIVAVSQHTYVYEKNTQNKYIIPNKSHNIDLIFSLENTRIYPWMHKDENFEKNGSISFNPGNTEIGTYAIEINYTSVDTSVWNYSGDIIYNVEIVDHDPGYWPIFTQILITTTGTAMAGCITAFAPALYQKLVHKLNNDYGYNLPSFSNTSAGQYYFKSTVGSSIGYVCGLDGVCEEVQLEQNLDHIANNI